MKPSSLGSDKTALDPEEPHHHQHRLVSLNVRWAGFVIGGLIALGCMRSDQPPAEDRPAEPPPSPVAASSTFHAANGEIQPAGMPPKHVAPHGFEFEEMPAEAWPSFAYRNGEDAGANAILESLGGGIGVVDYDCDGRIDCVASGGGLIQADRSLKGLPNALFRNLDGSFKLAASDARIEECPMYSHGVAVADYDNDGFSDVLITGYGRVELFHNQGDGTFAAATASTGLKTDRWASSAAWTDLNNDGNLDLYIACYVNWSFDNDPPCFSAENGQRDICPPKSFQALPHYVFLSDGQGSFADSSSSCGLRMDGKGLGVVSADFDHDGDLDIYVANDTTDNFLYLNQSNAKFIEAGIQHGVAVDDRGLPNGSMGASAYDYDSNGWIDLWVTNYEREAFAIYQNQGAGNFVYSSRQMGITSLGGGFVGFGTDFADFDADGQAEIVVANGHVIKFPTAAPRKQLPLLLALEKGRFVPQAFPQSHYFSHPHEGRGLAIADVDGDTRPDVIVAHLNAPICVMRNRSPQSGQNATITLVGTKANRDAIGTHVFATVAGKRIVRQVVGGGSYLSTSQKTISFAIPAEQKELEIEVHWLGAKAPQLATIRPGANLIIQPR